ncbi:class I SAM-dependent methyltransferase [Parvularcula sp. LCG005]|uniref:class I SAM-dependent methyltransferase n=1 Tax=Parvularcula sp. LCG005 TaxID=3078805 RepID=UPI00294327C9|nr:SAM-dependent methyltransferase [Parvularcula sp. LCG005]WOI54630.1 SAM-dependent methyltransferase [Parvularcula sp. LCG005]
MSENRSPSPPPPSPLEARLLDLIAENGPISVADFMADALIHPQHGYYVTQDPFGADGDFTTAPEISQIFGELVGAWLVQAWQDMGAPSYFQLVELGPGRGTLMADILRVGKLRPAFLSAARIFMVEAGGRQRMRQQRKLQGLHNAIQWVDALEDVPLAPTLIVANEFFDCLPVRQFVRIAEKSEKPWRERMVGRTSDGDDARLAYCLSAKPLAPLSTMPSGAKPEDIFEDCPMAREMIEDIAGRFQEHKGRALIIDYGHGRSAYGDTLQAVRRHDHWHPLSQPGLADITAHVDFGALARTARHADVRVDGPVQQGDFLERLGLIARLEQLLAAVQDEQSRTQLVAGTGRLMERDATGMGALFKVLALSSPDLTEPPGFS